jgi:hypothetical protein
VCLSSSGRCELPVRARSGIDRKSHRWQWAFAAERLTDLPLGPNLGQDVEHGLHATASTWSISPRPRSWTESAPTSLASRTLRRGSPPPGTRTSRRPRRRPFQAAPPQPPASRRRSEGPFSDENGSSALRTPSTWPTGRNRRAPTSSCTGRNAWRADIPTSSNPRAGRPGSRGASRWRRPASAGCSSPAQDRRVRRNRGEAQPSSRLKLRAAAPKPLPEHSRALVAHRHPRAVQNVEVDGMVVRARREGVPHTTPCGHRGSRALTTRRTWSRSPGARPTKLTPSWRWSLAPLRQAICAFTFTVAVSVGNVTRT